MPFFHQLRAGLLARGMEPLDAVMHMFTTVSLGGLSSHDASFAHFQSPLLEGIALVFMLVASCNFALYFVALRKGHWGGFWRDPELRATLTALLGGGLFVSLLLWIKDVYAPLDALRPACSTSYRLQPPPVMPRWTIWAGRCLRPC